MYLANMYIFNDQHGNGPDLKDTLLRALGETQGFSMKSLSGQLGKKDSEPFQVQVRKFGRRLKGPRRNLD